MIKPFMGGHNWCLQNFKKNQDNSDIFKKLIHRLSDISVQNLEKIDWLLDIIFIPYQESKQLKTEVVFR